jgi:thiamine pyrophosphokinase
MGTYVVVVGGGSLRLRAERPCHRVAGAAAVLAGDVLPADVLPADVIIAVDSGLDVAREIGLLPSLVVGDLDSVSADGLAWARAAGVPIEAHPADKDATDTELALGAARRCAVGDDGAVLRLLCGAATDRLDHLLGIVAALGAPEFTAFRRVRADIGTTAVHIVHPGHDVCLELPAGDVFSLLSLHGGCTGVDVEGARWPLHAARLAPAATVGISNESTGVPVRIGCAGGVLTVVVPAVTR